VLRRSRWSRHTAGTTLRQIDCARCQQLGDLFAYKIIEIPNNPADTVNLRSTDDRAVTGLFADSWEMSEDGNTVTVKPQAGHQEPLRQRVRRR
jgi:hypothetical protein